MTNNFDHFRASDPFSDPDSDPDLGGYQGTEDADYLDADTLDADYLDADELDCDRLSADREFVVSARRVLAACLTAVVVIGTVVAIMLALIGDGWLGK